MVEKPAPPDTGRWQMRDLTIWKRLQKRDPTMRRASGWAVVVAMVLSAGTFTSFDPQFVTLRLWDVGLLSRDGVSIVDSSGDLRIALWAAAAIAVLLLVLTVQVYAIAPKTLWPKPSSELGAVLWEQQHTDRLSFARAGVGMACLVFLLDVASVVLAWVELDQLVAAGGVVPSGVAMGWARMALFVTITLKFSLYLVLLGPPVFYGLNPNSGWKGAPSEPAASPATGADVEVGVAFSGGGIRSAAFSLGAIQTLQKTPWWQAVDSVTAVSGGSYAVAAWEIVDKQLSGEATTGTGNWLAQTKSAVVAWLRAQGFEIGVADADDAQRQPFTSTSPELTYLRNRTNYLAPRMMGKLQLTARWLRGFLANALLVAAAIVPLALLTAWWIGKVPFSEVAFATRLWPAGIGAGASFLIAVGVQVGRRVDRPLRRSSFLRASDLAVRTAVLVFLVLVVIPDGIGLLKGTEEGSAPQATATEQTATSPDEEADEPDGDWIAWVQDLVQLLTGLGLGTAAVRAVFVEKATPIAEALASLIMPAWLLAQYLLLVAFYQDHLNIGDPAFLAVTLGAIGVLAVAWFADVNSWSMHAFYRERLSHAFAIRLDAGRAYPHGESERLSERQGAPDVSICCAANINREIVTPPGREALSYVVSRQSIGMPDGGLKIKRLVHPSRVNWWMTGSDAAGGLTLMSAVAASGAAVSPAMGRKSHRSLQALLAYLNIRLGLWLPNPHHMPAPPVPAEASSTEAARSDQEDFERPPHPRVLIYYFKELFSLHSIADRYLYVSDGGHWENLGLIELLRRRPKVAFCFDSGGDGPTSFKTLGEAIELAATELGCEIDIDPSQMRRPEPDEKASLTFADRAFAVGSIKYPKSEQGPAREGTLVYCRTTLTADAATPIKEYALKHRAFPHHSTLLQLFDGSRFEAYRMLGEAVTGSALDSLQTRGIKPSTARRTEQ